MPIICRDPFARTELHRDQLKPFQHGGASCDWCGGHAFDRAKRPVLYRYSTETDGGRRFAHKGLFCSAACFRSYSR